MIALQYTKRKTLILMHIGYNELTEKDFPQTYCSFETESTGSSFEMTYRLFYDAYPLHRKCSAGL